MMRNLFGGRRRKHFGHGKDLAAYRNETFALTQRVDGLLVAVADDIDALRRRALDPDEAVERLVVSEDALDVEAEQLRGMLAPEELHGLHMEYEANLERALRGIVTTERGCAITRLPHRPPDDEEPFAYYKRGHANVLHARLRMQEIVDVLLNWEPGRVAEATVAARLSREK
jgi:hypothetical protein